MAAALSSTLKEDEDINEVFDSIALSEERLSKEGFQEGFKKGSIEGEVEGFHLGYHRGAKIGLEVGYIKGVVEALLAIGKKQELDLPDKGHDALQKVLELVNNFPPVNTEDFDLIAFHDNVKARFRKVCSLLKIDITYLQPKTLSF